MISAKTNSDFGNQSVNGSAAHCCFQEIVLANMTDLCWDKKVEKHFFGIFFG